MKLSVIIITKNEAANIQECLDRVAFTDERIIVDSGSADDTVAIARAAGATVIETTDWPGFGPQKNRALDASGFY
jgi:glycosyltransferase involved in cell wall biosynthesis